MFDAIFGPSVEKLEKKRDRAGLVAALAHRKPETRAAAARALSNISSYDAVKDLAGLLRDPVADVRKAAVSSIGWLHGKEVAPALVPLLRDADVETRRQAVWALARLRHETTFEPLLEALDDADEQTRFIAYRRLKEWVADNPRVAAARDSLRKRLAERAAQWWAGNGIAGAKRCDICTGEAARGSGYLLETVEMLECESYLDYATELRMKAQPIRTFVPGLDAFAQSMMDQTAKSILAMTVRNEIRAVRTPWLVCEPCLERYVL